MVTALSSGTALGSAVSCRRRLLLLPMYLGSALHKAPFLMLVQL